VGDHFFTKNAEKMSSFVNGQKIKKSLVRMRVDYMENIHIYHTNDVHSHFDHWPRIHHLLSTRKRWHEENEDEVLIFDIGDHMDRWHPFSEATRGKGNTRLLNQAGYTAVTIGNNEGITLSYEDLDTMYENAQFHVLAANLFQSDGVRPDWVRPYMLYTTKCGTRIGIIGLTAYFSHFYHLLGWQMSDPIEELMIQLKELKGKTDIIILLSHLGINEDEQIAERFPEIDVILGAHTHHIFHEGKEINDCILGAAGKHGRYVGHVMLEVNERKKIVSKKALLYDTNELEPVPNEDQFVKELYQAGKDMLLEKAVDLPGSLLTDNFQEAELPVILCKALREWTQADCAFLNSGLILDQLNEGTVTKYDLLRVCPHPINPCVVELSGRELKEVILDTLDSKWQEMQVKGLGFRGTVMGKFVYDRITFRNNDHNDAILINYKEIDSDAVYKVAIPDMFTFGRFFPAIFRAEKKKYFLPEFLRDLLEWKLKRIFR
jgi:5'-nucleotidase